MERMYSAKVWLVFLVLVVLGCGGGGPSISSLTAEPGNINSGEATLLTWKTANAKEVRLEPGVGVVDLNGSLALQPRQTTEYTLTASDLASPPVVVSKKITVNVQPSRKVAIRALPGVGAAPLAVKFTPLVETDTAINSYQWDFNDDGVVDSSDVVGRDISYTYRQPGDYKARINASDTLGNTYSNDILISVLNAPPAVVATPSVTSGIVPVTVSFSVTASDNEGMQTFEWDFDGDGNYDVVRQITTTSQSTTQSASYIFSSVGTFKPIVRVTDRLGLAAAVSTPGMEFRALPAASPVVRMSLTPATGNVPLGVTFTASTTLPSGSIVQTWAWDFDGNGETDSVQAPPLTHTYATGGEFFPRASIVTSNGGSAVDVKRVSVVAPKNLTITDSTINPRIGQTSTINTQFAGAERMRIQIEDAAGALVRVVAPWQNRAPGTYSDAWDGRDAAGNWVVSGPYYAVLLYGSEGSEQRLDLRFSTGGAESNPPRTTLDSQPVSPFDNQPAQTTFTLSKPSEVTAFMGLLNTNVRLVTFFSRTPLGAGSYTVTWNGEDASGRWIPGDTSNPFLFGIFAYSLADNVIYVSNGPAVSGMYLSPSIVSPLSKTTDSDGFSRISFDLTAVADVELVVGDIDTGKEVFHGRYTNRGPGRVELTWNAKSDDGNFVAPGRYRIGVRAIDSLGNRSMFLYGMQRVYY